MSIFYALLKLLVVIVVFVLPISSSWDLSNAFTPIVIRNPIKHIHVWGMFNTGTNLHTRLLHTLLSNFGVNVTPGTDSRWKHFPPWLKSGTFQTNFPIPHSETLHVVMIRHPFVWMESTVRDPYNLDCHGHVTKCTLNLPRVQQIRQGMPEGIESFTDLAEFWNYFYGNYTIMALQRRDMIVLRYEQVLEKPIETMRDLMEMAKWPNPYSTPELRQLLRKRTKGEARQHLDQPEVRRYLQMENKTHFDWALQKWKQGNEYRTVPQYIRPIAGNVNPTLCRIYNYSCEVPRVNAWDSY